MSAPPEQTAAGRTEGMPEFSIARFASAWPGRMQQRYVAGKVRWDPLYPAAFAALRDCPLPLLDVGCGMGLWPFYLRAHGWSGAIQGLDYDAEKIVAAQKVALTLGPDIQFHTADARTGLPEHAGSVTILDILQYLPAEAQRELLLAAAARVAPGGRFLLRSGLGGTSWRARVTIVTDRMAAWIRWMKEVPVCYPTAEFLCTTLESAGLTGGLTPLWGRTPFNNWLGVWTRQGRRF